MAHCLIITNNRSVYERYKEDIKVLYLEGETSYGVFEKARDMIHMGSKLLSHPMAGSIMLNQMPYRSLLLQETDLETRPVDVNSLNYIEKSLDAAARPSANSIKQWPCQPNKDYGIIDMSIIRDAITKSGVCYHS